MKNLFILFACLICISCKEQPTCDKQEVKDFVVQKIENDFLNEVEIKYFSKNYNYNDIVSYANDRGLDFEKLNNEKREEVKLKAKEYAVELLKRTTIVLENLRTTEVTPPIRKCSCVADIVINRDKNGEISYSAQYTSDNKLYITIYK